MTRPPRSNRSKLVLTDMTDLPCHWPACLACRSIAKHASYYTNRRIRETASNSCSAGATDLEGKRFDERKGHGGKRDFLAAGAASGLPDQAVASDPRRLVPGEV